MKHLRKKLPRKDKNGACALLFSGTTDGLTARPSSHRKHKIYQAKGNGSRHHSKGEGGTSRCADGCGISTREDVLRNRFGGNGYENNTRKRGCQCWQS